MARGHRQSPATRAKISASLKRHYRLTGRQKSDNIQRRAREGLRSGRISQVEFKRRMSVSGRVRHDARPVTGPQVNAGDMNSALASMLARSNKPGHAALGRKMRG
jgi:hypothetical protein